MLNVITPKGARIPDEMLDLVVGGITDKDKLKLADYIYRHKIGYGESLEKTCEYFRAYYDLYDYKFDSTENECIEFIKLVYAIII